VHPFRAAIEAQDMDSAVALLSDEVVFSSPVVFKPYTGRDVVAPILYAVFEVFEDFRYEREIGAEGAPGDNNTIQIGAQGTQTTTSIAGIYGTQATGGSAVYVTSTGQLGVQGSSERFKTDIASMPAMSSEKLQQLRPVTFHYKTDPQGVRQYGLIAEEVDKVYPELVIRDDSGKIQGVRYEELAPMLLKEVQDQAAEIGNLKQQQQTQLAVQSEHAASQDAEIRDLKRLVVEMQAGLLKLQVKDQLLAQR